MARLLRLSTSSANILGLASVLASLLIGAAALYGQATTPSSLGTQWQPQQNTWNPSVGPANMASAPNFYTSQTNTWTPQTNTWTPQTNGFPNSGNNLNPPSGPAPGPYTRPTREQTQWYVDNHPDLKYLPPYMKEPIVNGSPGALDLSMVPYQAYEAFHSNYGGGTIPNWYLPSTWPSPNMNWQGVQSNGFVPTSSTYNAYNPSSFNTTYNPSYNSTYNPNYNNTYNRPTYQPNQPPPARYSTPALLNAEAQRNAMTNSVNRMPLQDYGRTSVDLKNAIAGRERALAVGQAAGDKVAQVSNHAELARLMVESGKPEQSLAHLKAAEPLAQSLGDSRQQAELLRIKGAVYLSTGDFDRAISTYHESIMMVRSQNDEIDPSELFKRIGWYSNPISGTPDALSSYLDQAISAFSEPIADPMSRSRETSEAEVLTSIGWAYQSMGKVTEALANYKDAKALFTKLGDKDGLVRTQIAIASLYQSIGEPEKAIAEYKQLPPVVSKTQYIRVLVSVAEILQSRNQPSEALSRYRKALPLAQATGDPMQEAVILAGMSRCYMAIGVYETPRGDLKLALTKMREAYNRAGEAGVIADLGELSYWEAINSPVSETKRLFSQALEYYGQALPLMREVGDRNGEIGVLANTGLVYDAWRKPNEALNYYLQALQRMEELQVSARLGEFRIDVSGQAAGLYERAILLEVSQHNMREAFELSERARARVFLDEMGTGRSSPGGRVPVEFSVREEKLRQENTLFERQIGQELAKPGPEINTERLRALQARLTAVRKEYEDAVRDLKIFNPEYASLVSVSPLPLPELQKQLGHDVTVISYFDTPAKTLAFVIKRNGFDVVKLPVTAQELTAAIDTFRDFSGENSALPTLKQLYKWLVAPLKSHLNTSTLAIIPHGAINDLPFAALSPDGEHFISDKYAVFYLPSVNVLPYLHPKNNTGGDPIFVLANDKGAGLPRLNYANDEARAVASVYGVQPTLGEAATAAKLRTQAGGYGIVHLIAHVSNDRQNPRFSRIATSEPNAEEGPLELNQVIGLDLRKTNLVVLSGCESQLGRRSKGDDVIGLSRAFMFAGAPSVIASLWNVDDEATQQLMVAFYTHLKAGLSKAEALRAAEFDVRKEHPNPYYWAGFVLTGDPGSAGTFSLVASAVK